MIFITRDNFKLLLYLCFILCTNESNHWLSINYTLYAKLFRQSLIYLISIIFFMNICAIFLFFIVAL